MTLRILLSCLFGFCLAKGSATGQVIPRNPGERIESSLRFLKPFKSTSDCYLLTEDAGNGRTKVTWSFAGKNKFPISIMMLFMNMDKSVGKDFEEGLDALKGILEGKK